MKRALLYPVMLALACGMAVGQSQYKVLYSFGTNGSKDGHSPNAGFVYHSGELYGTTQSGGANCDGGCGTVFAMESFYGNIAEAVIYSFCVTGDPNNCPDGAYPFAGLVTGSDGSLYGTTAYGGTGACTGQYGGCGTVFKLSRVSRFSWTETVLHSFDGEDGQNPYELTIDEAGNLYGTTVVGGAYGGGTVFELSPGEGGTWAISTLHDFDPAVGDGSNPAAALVGDSFGNFYGTTLFGGGNGCKGQGCGTVFQLSQNGDGTWTESIIHTFGANQVAPQSSLTLDQNGVLYGTTSGYSNNGGVFRLVNSGGIWKESAFFFNGQNGRHPCATVVLKSNTLYGTTSQGGTNDLGTVFKIEDGKESVLHSFVGYPGDGTFGSCGGPLLSGQGALYGATGQGGAFNIGTIYQLTP
jgi:uncharacterized repeat protein (TIGR03803 family)